jgi:hypothetical protein
VSTSVLNCMSEMLAANKINFYGCANKEWGAVSTETMREVYLRC